MPNLKNQQQLEELKSALKDSKAIILANYSGLSVNAQNQLRADLSANGGKFAVTKNTLMARALKEMLGELPEGVLKALEGPNATLFIKDDPVTPTKALVKFTEGHEDKPEIKLGLLDGKVMTFSEIIALSKLPGREELLGMLVRQLNAPISGFAQVLRGNLQNLVYAIEAIRVKQS